MLEGHTVVQSLSQSLPTSDFMFSVTFFHILLHQEFFFLTFSQIRADSE